LINILLDVGKVLGNQSVIAK